MPRCLPLTGVCLTRVMPSHTACRHTANGWTEVIAEIRSMRLDRLGLIHANDCKFERGYTASPRLWIGDGRSAAQRLKPWSKTPHLQTLLYVRRCLGST
jgi:hypothetical protein